ncbi:DMT family transporter [Gilvimarinus sp. F26214L]|uniref:DMT family transporter n=1 Tax=Gilvimarinus sp. DZF01 TaxID=3461371 RepID=UPI004045F2F0
MKVLIAYWSVILIWSTTPLGIATSNNGLTFWTAAGLRMLLAFALIMTIIAVRREPFLPNRRVALAYFVASLGLSPQMSLVYWAAQHVPTGVMSLVFAFNPCLTALASLLILRDTKLVLRQVVALLMAVGGMGIIYIDQLSLGTGSGWGLAALFLSTTIFAISSTWLKRLTSELTLDPFCQTGGTLLFAMPVYFLVWLAFDGQPPTSINLDAGVAIFYLALVGSVGGFTLYFYILRHMSVMTVSLTTLITPVIAMTIGAVFLDEPVTLQLVVGAAIVLVSLLLFQGVGLRYLRRVIDRRAARKKGLGTGIDEEVPAPAAQVADRGLR